MSDVIFLDEQFFDVLEKLFPEIPQDCIKILYFMSIGMTYSSIQALSELSEGKVKHRTEKIMRSLSVSSLLAVREIYHCRLISYFVNMQIKLDSDYI
ncbi:hypothetical protein V9N52_004174 [Vibrio navarrensis]